MAHRRPAFCLYIATPRSLHRGTPRRRAPARSAAPGVRHPHHHIIGAGEDGGGIRRSREREEPTRHTSKLRARPSTSPGDTLSTPPQHGCTILLLSRTRRGAPFTSFLCCTTIVGRRQTCAAAGWKRSCWRASGARGNHARAVHERPPLPVPLKRPLACGISAGSSIGIARAADQSHSRACACGRRDRRPRAHEREARTRSSESLARASAARRDRRLPLF